MTVQQAQELGKQSYLEGKDRAPYLNEIIMQATEKLDSKNADKFLKAYLKGWDIANINAAI